MPDGTRKGYSHQLVAVRNLFTTCWHRVEMSGLFASMATQKHFERLLGKYPMMPMKVLSALMACEDALERLRDAEKELTAQGRHDPERSGNRLYALGPAPWRLFRGISKVSQELHSYLKGL